MVDIYYFIFNSMNLTKIKWMLIKNPVVYVAYILMIFITKLSAIMYDGFSDNQSYAK
jgi:hypothetical protein